MEVLFTRNSSLMSRLIRSVTREEVSHCGILVGDYVIHSNLLGVQCELLSDFEDKSEIVYRVSLEEPKDLTDRLVRVFQLRGRFYDFGALLFVGISLLLRSKLGIPLPKSNLWANTGMYLCTELVTDIVYAREDAMLTPSGLYSKLVNRKKEK